MHGPEKWYLDETPAQLCHAEQIWQCRAFFPDAPRDPASLRLILESNTIPKVRFAISGMSRLLFRQLNVSLGGMYDLQLMELGSRNDRQSKNAVNCRWPKTDNSINICLFSSHGHDPCQSTERIKLFPALWSIDRCRLDTPDEAFWLSSARLRQSTHGPSHFPPSYGAWLRPA
ncbi:Uncharacterized protein HZ326_23477 [Fusarium oxysporum f. sp. albedinis]|nr:Uncharacterized protein HZ326_23477 [Fusarium oxysporum f. sp. albedinis]